MRPAELDEAETVIALCDRWHKTPDEVLAMDVRALYYLDVVNKGFRETSG